jgi:hypothetical protein
MEKKKKSGSAIFMYCVIAVTLLLSVACFVLYYANIVRYTAVLWTGITVFTILYHFWLRIIMGNVTKLFRIHYGQRWFRELPFEKKLYKLLRVRHWKEKVLTYDPDAFDVGKHSLEEIASTMSKSEVDHWINELISLSTILFGLIWGQYWIFAVTAVVAMLFDAQFIVVQRYNRPVVLRSIALRAQRAQ